MRILITRIFALAILALILCTSSRWETHGEGVGTALFMGATILVGIAALGRLWCSLYIAGRKDRKLVTEGPYSMSRNPLYVFSFIGAVGVGLATETITVPLLLGVTFLLYYPFVIKKEEIKLEQLFPVEFPLYAARVPRFFPRSFKLVESEHYDVNPKIFRRHLGSAVWFIWIIGVLELVEHLHELHLLPSYALLF